jgi:hypothetical protein
MVSIEVVKYTQLGSLVPLKSWTSDELGFFVPCYACVWFLLSLGSILIKYVAV